MATKKGKNNNKGGIVNKGYIEEPSTITTYPTEQTVVVKVPENTNQDTETVKDYTCKAVVATIWFWPIGIFAIIMAYKSRKALARGDIRAAIQHGLTADLLYAIALLIGFLAYVAVAITVSILYSSSSGSYDSHYHYYNDEEDDVFPIEVKR